MNINQLKLQLVQHILNTDDVALLKRVQQILAEQPYELREDEAAQLNDPPSWYEKAYGGGPVATEAQIDEALHRLERMHSGADQGVSWAEVQSLARSAAGKA